MTNEMSKDFERQYEEIDKPQISESHINELQKKVDKLTKEIKTFYTKGPKSDSGRSGNKNSKGYNDKPLSQQEKKTLGQNIRKLPPHHLRGVWEIVNNGLDTIDNNEELEFDIDTLSYRKARELERFVRNKLALIGKKKKAKTNKQRDKSISLNQNNVYYKKKKILFY